MSPQEKRELYSIHLAIQQIGVSTATDHDVIVDKLTGWAWDEEEAENIKKMNRLTGGWFKHCY